MDGRPPFYQPPQSGWLRLLFLATGFTIAAMCLWAFVEKRSRISADPDQNVPFASSNAPKPLPATLLQSTDADEHTGWPNESPAREAIRSATHLQAIDEPDDESAGWRLAAESPALPASFDSGDLLDSHVDALRATTVSKPPLEPLRADDHFLPLPELASLPVEAEAAPADAFDIEPPPEQVEQQPNPSRPESVVTEANDSFWNIAERVYGDPRYYAALFEHNRSWIAYPDEIEEGFRVMTPPVEELRERYAKLCPDERR